MIIMTRSKVQRRIVKQSMLILQLINIRIRIVALFLVQVSFNHSTDLFKMLDILFQLLVNINLYFTIINCTL